MGEKSKFYITTFSCNEEVTGSCHYVTVTKPDEKIRFIVDCGTFQEKKYENDNQNLIFNPENLNFALITHVHMDHVGRVPLLYKKGFSNKLYMSNDAFPFYKEALLNTANIYAVNAKRKKNSNVLFTKEDVKNTFNRINLFDFEESNIFYPQKDIKVTCFENNHQVGASTYLVEISEEGYENINLLFLGDYSENSAFKAVSNFPDYLYKMNLTIFTESTYGDTNSKDIEKVFEKNILNALAKNQSIFIPSFAMERCQTILLQLKKMQDNGKIDTKIPIYLDGSLSITMTNIFLKISKTFKKEAQQFIPQNLIYVNKSTRDKVINDNCQRIIISSSGMCSYGPAPLYIKNFITKKNYLIHLTGYPAEGSLSRKLFDVSNQTTNETDKTVKCDVKFTSEFSSHAKKDELIKLLKKFNNLKLLMISHGSTETKKAFEKSVLKEVKVKNVCIESRYKCFKLNSYGLLKSYQIND